jgi:hydrogenase nickel incorporation protein HypB
MEIDIEQDLFDNEARLAEENRQVFRERGVMPVNLLASPGAGKTSFIRQLKVQSELLLTAIEGDPASSIDTDLLNSLGIPAFQINTEGGCHLEAMMVGQALKEFQPARGSVLFIENVGNLICTASFPLGEALRLVMLGVSEGDDKPIKYPLIFEGADAVILNKMDLAPYVDFDRDRFYHGVRVLQPEMPVFEVSCKTGAGFPQFINWLEGKVQSYFHE